MIYTHNPLNGGVDPGLPELKAKAETN